MTRKELRQGHVELWTWLEKTGKSKCFWPGWRWNGGPYPAQLNECFACAAAELTYQENGDIDYRGCARCPIAWTKARKPGRNNGACTGMKTEFLRWLDTDNIETRKRLAAKIATMWPEEEGDD